MDRGVSILAEKASQAAQRAADALKHYEDTSGLLFVGSPDVASDVMEEIVTRFLADLEHYCDVRFEENLDKLFMAAHQLYLKDKAE